MCNKAFDIYAYPQTAYHMPGIFMYILENNNYDGGEFSCILAMPTGTIRFWISKAKKHPLFVGSAGNMVLYRPKEEQRYYYYGIDHTEVY